ncbi:MAG: 16S rRNA (guanine(966)-N(2))-methyltransferase RsmD [Planctomycetota bacterium]
MRIIAGQYRRRRLQGPPAGATTRPIPDSVKEAIFNLLRGHFEGEAVVDLFAGTGALGIEALSRGASKVVFVERDRRVIKILEENLAEVGSPRAGEIAAGDALGTPALSRCPKPVHIIFMDPPYALVREPESWDRVRAHAARMIAMLDDTGYCVLRTPWPHIYRPDDPAVDRTTASSAVEAAGELAQEMSRGANPNRPRPIDLDLSIEGAIGPETHAYGTTAVHLYMRDTGDAEAHADAGDSPPPGPSA